MRCEGGTGVSAEWRLLRRLSATIYSAANKEAMLKRNPRDTFIFYCSEIGEAARKVE